MKRRTENRPDVSVDELATRDLIKRILKLRWIGMEAEAERLLTSEFELHHRPATVTTVLGHPTDLLAQEE